MTGMEFVDGNRKKNKRYDLKFRSYFFTLFSVHTLALVSAAPCSPEYLRSKNRAISSPEFHPPRSHRPDGGPQKKTRSLA